jgi:hypothetical protein
MFSKPVRDGNNKWRNLLTDIFDDEIDALDVNEVLVHYLNEEYENETREVEEGLNNAAETKMMKDGSRKRMVNRSDYSRGPKFDRPQSDPNLTNTWMQWLNDNSINDPTSRRGKEFRARFRLAYPVFIEVVQMCKDSGDHLFNYGERDCCHAISTPVEVKVLFVLRVLAGGLRIIDGADMCEHLMSKSEGNRFFDLFIIKFCELFESEHIRPLSGDEYCDLWQHMHD